MATNNSASRKVRGLSRRPVVIVICAAIYLLNPIGNILNQWLVSSLGFAEFVSKLWGMAAGGDVRVILNVALWVLAPFVAVGIYRVRLWGWILFLVHATAATVLSVLGPGWHLGLSAATFINLPFFLIAGYFLFSEIRAPYFNPRLRWWERNPRYRDSIRVFIEGREYRLFDISARGMFIADSEAMSRSPGTRMAADLSIGGESVTLSLELVRTYPGGENYPTGFGVRFRALDRKSRELITTYIRELKRNERDTIATASLK